jgi:Zinc finger, C2H2 type
MFDVVFTCDECPRLFVTEKALKLHRNIHDEDFCGHFCDQCGDLFSHPSGLMRHVDLDHQNGKDKKHKCSECPRSFDLRINFHIHMTAEHKEIQEMNESEKEEDSDESKTTRWSCEDCDKKFPTRRQLLQHRKEVHCVHRKSARNFIECHFCQQKFSEMENFRLHLRFDHQQIEETKFSCRFCKKKFNYQRGIYRHMKEKHPHCISDNNKQTSRSTDWQKNFKVQNRKKLKFCCKDCGFKFVHEVSLSQHCDLNHPSTSGGLNKCNFCKFSFKYKRSLECHMRRNHSQVS